MSELSCSIESIPRTQGVNLTLRNNRFSWPHSMLTSSIKFNDAYLATINRNHLVGGVLHSLKY